MKVVTNKFRMVDCVSDTEQRKNGTYECSYDGCTNQVVSGGVCFKHGAKKSICSQEGCVPIGQGMEMEEFVPNTEQSKR